MTTLTHPAESLEFLSRLHDGELARDELEAFEAHRRECGECRQAVAAFERSLVAFRAAPEAPAPSDLSARILRKIRSQTPTRRPFGVMFGIDIRWAGVFLAAILVAIIAPALLERRAPRAVVPSSAPLTAYVVDSEADKDAARNAAQPEAAPRNETAAQNAEPSGGATRSGARESAKIVAESPALPERGAKERARAENKAAPDTERAAAPAAAPERERLQAAAPAPAPPSAAGGAAPSAGAYAAPAAPQSSARRSAVARQRATDEVGAAAKEEAQAGDVSLDVRALDSGGAPALLHYPAPERLVPLRGRAFVLIVEAQGSVQAVLPANEDQAETLQKDAAAPAAPSDAPLRELRFQASGRPRRILVSVR